MHDKVHDLPNNIVNIRKNLKLNQQQFAKKLGISIRILTEYEKGRKEPKADTILKIAKIGNVSLDSLFFVLPSEENECSEYEKQVISLMLELTPEEKRWILETVEEKVFYLYMRRKKNIPDVKGGK